MLWGLPGLYFVLWPRVALRRPVDEQKEGKHMWYLCLPSQLWLASSWRISWVLGDLSFLQPHMDYRSLFPVFIQALLESIFSSGISSHFGKEFTASHCMKIPLLLFRADCESFIWWVLVLVLVETAVSPCCCSYPRQSWFYRCLLCPS